MGGVGTHRFAHRHGHVRAVLQQERDRSAFNWRLTGARRSGEVGPQRFTNDVGFVDTVTVGALLEQIRELVIQPGVDGW
jgi:hypothetical protein